MDTPKRMGRPPIYGERTKLLIRLPVELVAKLEAKASKTNLSTTAAVQQAVERWVGRKHD